jgi:hypothetical protein
MAAAPWGLADAVDDGRRALDQVRFAVVLALALAVGCGPEETGGEGVFEAQGAPIVFLEAKPDRATAPLAMSMPLPEWSADDDELPMVGFDLLAGYDYEGNAAALGLDGSSEASAIPEPIRALDGRHVAIKGFMLPLRLQGGLVTELLLMRDQSLCCFGVIPRMNDWVGVTMAAPGVRALMDQPVIIYGRLHVGEIYDNGLLTRIYHMEGEELLDALDL